MSSISTHVLDLVRGGPASGIPVTLEHWQDGAWLCIASGVTDADGRIKDLLPKGNGLSGSFQISFATGAWLSAQGTPGFYPYVPIVFQIPQAGGHYHVPLLLGPFGYSTYRGS